MKTMVKKGFTLIELLIVIAIIGILAVAFLPSLLDAPAKARDTQRIANVQGVSNALTNEFLAGAAYPTALAGECVIAGGSFDDLMPTLGGALPVDPQSANETALAAKVCAGSYLYVSNPGGSDVYSYGLYTHLENATGNIACTAAGVVSDPEAIVTTNDQDCYGLLVQ